MHFLSEMDWGFLEAFFGEHGKLITTCVAFVGAFIGLMVVSMKYLHARILQRERDEARRDLRRTEAALENERALVQQQMQSLKTKEGELDGKSAELMAAKATLTEQQNEIKSREEKLNVVRTAFSGKDYDLWCVHKDHPPSNYNQRLAVHRNKPIITVANLKGGVGKTTLTANLAAFLSHAGMRVLLIDADYQGSLSNMLLSADRVTEVSADVSTLLALGADATTFKNTVRPFERIIRGSAIVSSAYGFASFENQMMIEYLLHEDRDDGRYRLAKLLLDEEVSSTFDIALIDAPPRLTAGTINALCASTHLLIPTVFDKLSAEAVGTFAKGVHVLKTHLNPMIELLGVAGTLTYQQQGLNAREQQAKNIAVEQVQHTWGAHSHFFDRHIPRREAIATAAGESLAYFTDDTVKRWFDELGQEVLEQLKLSAFPPANRPRPNGRQFPQQRPSAQPGAEA
jgi:cellulose biosynthesis protein BcsQ